MSHRTLTLVCASAVALTVAACSGGSKKAASSTRPTSTTAPATTGATTTTTGVALPVAPLTGLPQPDASKMGRPALVVKIDNLDPIARPQTGLTTADLCIEEQVEGGITRFACIWQSANTGLVGPIRSTRTTDVAIVSALNHPLYASSGGQPSFVAIIRAAPIFDIGADAESSRYYFRYGPKPAPHNLFSRVDLLYGLTPKKGIGPPPPQFRYRPTGQPATGAGAAAAVHVELKFPGSGGPLVAWDWDAASGTWGRSQNGSADVTTDGGQIKAANIIFEFVNYVIVGHQTIGNLTGGIPMAELVGHGPALIFTGGMAINATWTKPSTTSVTTFTDTSGAPVLLAPGKTWVELPPTGTPSTVR